MAPEAPVPPAIKDLKAEVIGDKVRLTWSVPKKGNKVFDGLGHFGVYKYKSHSSVEMCPGCPIPFEHFLDIKLDDPKPARVEGDRIICYDKIEADHRYAYKVVVYHKSGGVSEDSNIVQFVVKPNLRAPPRSKLEEWRNRGMGPSAPQADWWFYVLHHSNTPSPLTGNRVTVANSRFPNNK